MCLLDEPHSFVFCVELKSKETLNNSGYIKAYLSIQKNGGF